jgi:hypothetical protein
VFCFYKPVAEERPEIQLRSAPVETPARADINFSMKSDEVQFSAYHPRAMAAGDWHKLLVYAHTAAVLGDIARDAGQLLGRDARDYRQAQAGASQAIAPGTVITLVPQAPAIEFKPASARLTWQDAWQRADFEMRATEPARAGHVIEGSIACYAGPLLIADVRLPIVVSAGAKTIRAGYAAQEVQSAHMYQAVFASYSHADSTVVEAVETAYKALGMNYLRDVMTLKSGHDWSQELLNMIGRADVFQLFWSATASESAYVEQEWRFALELAGQKGPAFIRPVYWEKTIPRIPRELSSLHFAPVDFSGFTDTERNSAVHAVHLVADPVEPAVATMTPVLNAMLPGPGADLTTLTVSTYASAEPGNTDTANLKARTTISLHGNVETSLPLDVGNADERYLELHQKTVKTALEARLEYLRLVVKLAEMKIPEK